MPPAGTEMPPESIVAAQREDLRKLENTVFELSTKVAVSTRT